MHPDQCHFGEGVLRSPLSFDFIPDHRNEDAMPLIFAHHDMLDSLDVLHLHPTTPGEHAVAFAGYALLILGVACAARIGSGWCRTALADRRRQSGRRGPDALGLAEQRP